MSRPLWLITKGVFAVTRMIFLGFKPAGIDQLQPESTRVAVIGDGPSGCGHEKRRFFKYNALVNHGAVGLMDVVAGKCDMVDTGVFLLEHFYSLDCRFMGSTQCLGNKGTHNAIGGFGQIGKGAYEISHSRNAGSELLYLWKYLPELG